MEMCLSSHNMSSDFHLAASPLETNIQIPDSLTHGYEGYSISSDNDPIKQNLLL